MHYEYCMVKCESEGMDRTGPNRPGAKIWASLRAGKGGRRRGAQGGLVLDAHARRLACDLRAPHAGLEAPANADINSSTNDTLALQLS